jgi:hypothetical protein
MNILTDALPETVTCNTTEYQVRSSFRDCLRIMLAFEDNTLTGQEKQIILLNALYSVVPADISEAIKAANWFLNGGRDSDEESDGMRLFSFTTDANLIYAAFRQTHGIDLATAELHWWQFLALFMDLGSETTFCQLVALRKRIKTGKASKEERAAAREMGEMFDVPEVDTRTLEQKEAERRFFELVKLGEQKRNGNTV